MRELEGKVAVVTGGGSGIGRGMVLAFAEAGMHTVVADIEVDAAVKVCDEVAGRGARAIAVRVDVADLDSVRALCDETWGAFGAAHVLCNNAGVAVFGSIDEMTAQDWRWVLDVNLEGVVNGLQAFLPRMLAQDGEKHVVNTASIAGMAAFPTLGVYTATKYAVVGISETLRQEAASRGCGVSVLCPGAVTTRIGESGRNRPDGLRTGAEDPPSEMQGRLADTGMDPLEVGRIVREAVRNDELYIFTHPETRAMVEARFRDIMSAFDAAERRNR